MSGTDFLLFLLDVNDLPKNQEVNLKKLLSSKIKIKSPIESTCLSNVILLTQLKVS